MIRNPYVPDFSVRNSGVDPNLPFPVLTLSCSNTEFLFCVALFLEFQFVYFSSVNLLLYSSE